MPIAQVPSVSFDDMARFAVCVVLLAWVVQVLSNIYRTWFPYRPPRKQSEMYVTHEQFDAWKVEVNGKMDGLRTYIETKLNGFDKEVNSKLERLDTYMHESSHRTNNILAAQVAATSELRGILIGKVSPYKLPEEDGQ